MNTKQIVGFQERVMLFILLILTAIVSGCVSQAPETSEGSTEAQETTVVDSGDFRVVYSPVTNQANLEYETIFKEAQIFENQAQVLNDALILPYDITLNIAECGEENAFYDPSAKQIVMCYELMDHFAKVFYDYSENNTVLGTAMLNSIFFVFYHEVGHTVVDIYDLPATGNPEDNADQVSTLVLLDAEESGIDILLEGANWFFIKSEKSDVKESMFSDIHSPDRRRYYNLLCWIYGSDPQNGEYLITKWELPEDRASGCEDEYIRMSNSWNKLLSPYLK